MFSLPQDKTNYIIASTAVAALIVSTLALFANGLPNLLKPTKISLSFPLAIQINQYAGEITSSAFVYVRNEGGGDIAISKVDIEITDETNRVTTISGVSGTKVEGASTFRYNVTNSDNDYQPRLVGMRLRPGENMTISPNFLEKKSREQAYAIYELNNSLNKEARRQANRKSSELLSSIKDFLDGKKIPPQVLANINWANQHCIAADGELASKKQQLSETALKRFPAGKYTFKVTLYDENESVINVSKFESILFENALMKFKDIDHPTGQYCYTSNSESMYGYYNDPMSTLQFNLERSNK